MKEVVDYDDDKEEDEEVKSSISDILEGLYINDDEDVEDTNAGKQRPEHEDDERCPKRVKVEVHRVDDPSSCKAVVHLHKNDSNKAEVNEGHVMDESEEKSENKVQGSGSEVTKVEVSGDEVKDEDKKTDTVEHKEETP